MTACERENIFRDSDGSQVWIMTHKESAPQFLLSQKYSFSKDEAQRAKVI